MTKVKTRKDIISVEMKYAVWIFQLKNNIKKDIVIHERSI